jgi:hypothetical protein
MGGNDDRILVASDMALGRVGGRWRRKNQAAREKNVKGGKWKRGGLPPPAPLTLTSQKQQLLLVDSRSPKSLHYDTPFTLSIIQPNSVHPAG